MRAQGAHLAGQFPSGGGGLSGEVVGHRHVILIELVLVELRLAFDLVNDELDDGDAVESPGGRRLPFGLLVHGRYDTTGAERSVLSIASALGWRQSAEVLAVLGEVGGREESAAYELGATLAVLTLPTGG